MHKRYRALLQGRLLGEGQVHAPVFDKEAHTTWRALCHSRSLKFGGWINTADLFPHTGRKHQLRQHMASLGHPILGDPLYTPEGYDALQGQGMCLWASELAFPHPLGHEVRVEVPESGRFGKIRSQQQARWDRFEGAAAGAGGGLG